MTAPIALIADIHSNLGALDAVLADIDRRGITQIVNLGDSVYGSLDPAGTADRLIERGIPSVVGNQDREIFDPWPALLVSPDWTFVTDRLSTAQIDWMRNQPPTLHIGGIFCCHGTPSHDDVCLLERIAPHSVFLRHNEEIAAQVVKITEWVIACGHSHIPRVVQLDDGKLIVNPGSVGMPAYDHDEPYVHVMEAGSPHARYAIVQSTSAGWLADLIAVPYDWEAAAAVAKANGRPDRAEWIRTGRAKLPV